MGEFTGLLLLLTVTPLFIPGETDQRAHRHTEQTGTPTTGVNLRAEVMDMRRHTTRVSKEQTKRRNIP